MTEPSRLFGAVTGAVSFETAVLQTRRPEPRDIDELGHVNNAVYLVWAQQIAVAHWATAAGRGLIEKHLWVVLRHEIDYRDPVLISDEVEVRTWLGRADGPRFARHIDIRKKGSSRFSAKVLSDWCLLDAASRRPMRVTSEILEAFGVSGR
jgi:acyl-CoA thioester hydrolase